MKIELHRGLTLQIRPNDSRHAPKQPKNDVSIRNEPINICIITAMCSNVPGVEIFNS